MMSKRRREKNELLMRIFSSVFSERSSRSSLDSLSLSLTIEHSLSLCRRTIFRLSWDHNQLTRRERERMVHMKRYSTHKTSEFFSSFFLDAFPFSQYLSCSRVLFLSTGWFITLCKDLLPNQRQKREQRNDGAKKGTLGKTPCRLSSPSFFPTPLSFVMNFGRVSFSPYVWVKMVCVGLHKSRKRSRMLREHAMCLRICVWMFVDSFLMQQSCKHESLE